MKRLFKSLFRSIAEVRHRILIVGYARSGTTLLFSQIKHSLPHPPVTFFEPGEFAPIETALEGTKPVLIKVIIPAALQNGLLPKLNPRMTHKVLLARDPRDLIISSLLYGGATEVLWRKEPDQIVQILERLRQKEAHPADVPLIELFPLLRHHFDETHFFAEMRRNARNSLIFLETHPDYQVVRYEDMITHRAASLEAYLGFRLVTEVPVESEYHHVIRTKGSGNWRQWFTPTDVEKFRPIFDELMAPFGYSTADWELNHQPISPEHGSEYVKSRLNERRQQAGLSPI
ncbi:MAG: hypothetical protein D6675_02370 [Gemmatimonadetes bacterium]|nr:MAG: hypothetical protein D6675_02370 [Gemmatimonadota bacterium]